MTVTKTTKMKNYIPTKGIGLKRSLAKEFDVYNVNEYNTSKKCSVFPCFSYP